MNAADEYPKAYIDRMRGLLGPRFGLFEESLAAPPVKGLRFHPLKAREDTIRKLKESWGLRPVPWCPLGYIYREDAGIRPGLSPYHHAGVFYMQEPSAMSVAEALSVLPDDVVLDLCAAPGGKATQAAAKAALLVANEPVKKRARILSSNVERLGLKNVIVTSAMPEELASLLGGFFDRIIVDAPCSGEGMMRRDPAAVREWSPESVKGCAERQKEILGNAHRMLKGGGRLIYSTCTFEPAENEEQVRAFMERFPDYVLLDEKTLYPFEAEGEGQYYALLEKSFRDGDSLSGKMKKLKELSLLGAYLRKNGVHVLRCGLEEEGEKPDPKDKGKPSHAAALAADYTPGKSIDLKSEALCIRYLKGESLQLASLPAEAYELDGESGWLLVCYDRYPFSWGKLTGGILKNHYPKGLRLLS